MLLFCWSTPRSAAAKPGGPFSPAGVYSNVASKLRTGDAASAKEHSGQRGSRKNKTDQQSASVRSFFSIPKALIKAWISNRPLCLALRCSLLESFGRNFVGITL